ncbi:hypothetical protein D1871_11760 [Nakamurella silvestris]|nr:hypothetical protein D1871_11760 [Nakamurella silvestris]
MTNEFSDDQPAQALNVQDAPATRNGSGRRWVQVTAATLGAVVIGVGGYAIGNTNSSSPAAAPATVSPAAPSHVSLPSSAALTPDIAPAPAPVAGGEASGSNTASGSGPAGGRTASAGDSKMAYGYGGRIVFTAGDGLSTEAGNGKAWTFDPASVFSADTAKKIAGELGVKGEPRKEYGAWVIGPVDGTGPSVQVSPDGTASLSFYDPTIDPWACPTPAEGDSTTGGSDVAVAPTCTPVDSGPAPQGDKAVAKAKKVLTGLGVDLADLKFTAQDSGDTKSSYVTADLLIDGNVSGISWSISLVADGVQNVSGPLAPIVSLGDYPTISAKDAVARLSDPRFGSVGGPIMYDAAARGGAAVDVAPAEPAEPTVPALAKPGSAISWPVTDVTITKAELTTISQYQDDNSTLLIPAYLLSSADGSQWTVNAVADSALDFTAGS